MSFQQGLSGLNASAKALDTIGNNIANSSTGVWQQFTQGNITTTNNPLDVAINGGGFFQMNDGLGGTFYSRNGQFQLDKDGFIVDAQGLQLKGVMAVNGVVSSGGPNVPLRLFDPNQSLTGAPQATGTSIGATGVQANLNLDSRVAAPATTPFNYADPTSYNQSTAVTTFDSLGNPHTYSMYFVKTAANAWDVYSTVTNPAGASPTFSNLGLTGSLTFDTAGQLTSAPLTESLTAAQLGYAGGVNPMSFNLNFSGSTQFGSPFAVNTLLQDGYAAGSLVGFKIGSDGTVLGNYTNGQTAVIGQAVLATFRNPQGLQPLGNNVWAQTPESGTSILGTPGSSGQFGSFQSAAVEDANVDLTAELVNMITQQRVYQANAQSIKTMDSILQTLVNLR
jgi:flagellar hook protein FlgE